MAVAIVGTKFRAFNPLDGSPLAFGKVYTYQAGTNVPKVTYTTEGQETANTNPVILNAAGYADIYLDGSYKIVIKDSNDVEVHTTDPVSDPNQNQASWIYQRAATFVSPTSFSINGNETGKYTPGRRVRWVQNSGTEYGDIITSVYGGGVTVVTIIPDSKYVQVSVASAEVSILEDRGIFQSAIRAKTKAELKSSLPIAGEMYLGKGDGGGIFIGREGGAVGQYDDDCSNGFGHVFKPTEGTTDGTIGYERIWLDETIDVKSFGFSSANTGSQNLTAITEAKAVAAKYNTKVSISNVGTSYILTTGASYDITDIVGDGVITWNGNTFDIGAMHRIDHTSSVEKYLSDYMETIALNGVNVTQFVAYGDSTTDGNDSTLWQSNTGGDHNPGAPNSWPAIVTRTVAAILGGGKDVNPGDIATTRFLINNAGYGGKRADNGWAYENIEAAIINNTFYQDSKVCFIQFGINDSYFGSGYVTEAYISEITKVVKKLRGYGITPVLLTPDPVPRQRVDKMLRDVVNPLIELARNLGVKLIDVFRDMREYLNDNSDYTITELYSNGDYVHPNDLGFLVKAMVISRRLLEPFIFDTENKSRISMNVVDPRTDMWRLSELTDAQVGTGAAIALGEWGRFGLVPKLQNSTLVAGEVYMRALVWVSDDNYDLVWRQPYLQANLAKGNGAVVDVYSLAETGWGGVFSLTPYLTEIDAGGFQLTVNRGLEIADIVGRMKKGLNMVTAKVQSPVNFNGGYFQIQKKIGDANWHRMPGSAVRDAGDTVYQHYDLGGRFFQLPMDAGSTLVITDLQTEDAYLRNIMTVGDGVAGGSELRIKSGIGVDYGPAFLYNYWARSDNTDLGYYGYFLDLDGSNNVRIRRWTYDSASVLATGSPSAQPAGNRNYLIRVRWDTANTRTVISVFDGWTGASSLLVQYSDQWVVDTSVNHIPKSGLAYGGVNVSLTDVTFEVEKAYLSVPVK